MSFSSPYFSPSFLHLVSSFSEWAKLRGIFLTSVDLRWGITAEDTQSGTTIKVRALYFSSSEIDLRHSCFQICLAEIDRCRPYFVCMLGNRYGWAQPPAEAKKPKDETLSKTFQVASSEFDWVKKFEDRSVTELEVRHGVLNDVQGPTTQRALFYFRAGAKLGAAAIDDDSRLTKLKNEIESNSSLKVRRYAEIAKLAEMIYADLEKQLDADFPLQSLPTAIERYYDPLLLTSMSLNLSGID